MLFVEIPVNFNNGLNIIKYRNVKEEDWYYLYIDIETLNLLIMNFGIISVYRNPTKSICCDRPTTGNIIQMKYCGADIELNAKTKLQYARHFYLPDIEQNY